MTGQLLVNLVGSALLMGIVLMVRKPVGRLFGATAAFTLWLAPAVRLVMPQLPVTAPMPDILIETQAAASSAIEPVRAAFPIDTILLAAWAAGAVFFLAVHLFRYWLFVTRASALGQPFEPAAGEAAEVIETPLVSGPAAAGLIRPRVFVPQGFAQLFEREEQRLALKHELLHHRRGDLWASAAALVVLAVHWFNPLAYAAHRAFRRDLEGACDAELLAGAQRSERQAYARTILRCAAQPIAYPICALTDCKELKGRLTMMKQDISFARRIGGAAAALALSAGGLLIAMPAGAQQAEQERTEVRKVIMHGPRGDREMSPELRARMEKCTGEKFEVTSGAATSGSKVQKSRILICAKPGESKEQMAASLEKALGRIEGDSEMPASNKAEIVAKMKARIAELRAGK